jgi:hypothetical protein
VISALYVYRRKELKQPNDLVNEILPLSLGKYRRNLKMSNEEIEYVEHCENCGAELIGGLTWFYRDMKNNVMSCTRKECQQLKAEPEKLKRGRPKTLGKTKGQVKLTPEAKRSNLITRILDEERVNRLVGWIKQFYVQEARRAYQAKAMDNARDLQKDEMVAGKEAYDETLAWTFENIEVQKFRHKPESVMKAILLNHEIKDDPVLGDTPYTWHIGFARTGYQEFTLDSDGLPAVHNCGRTTKISQIRVKADGWLKGERLGIETFKITEENRSRGLEPRLILVKKEATLKIVEERIKAKHAKDAKQFAALERASQRDISSDKSTMDSWLDIERRPLRG